MRRPVLFLLLTLTGAPLAGALVSPAMVASASAAETQPFTAAAMKQAQAAGKPIVVDVSATWCTTCAAQNAIVAKLLKEPKFKSLVLLRIDYDKQKQAMHSFGVQERSTFVAFKGKTEVGRSTGDTDQASIEKLFDKTS